MNRIVKHRPEEGKPLYDYNSVSSYSDCTDRIVCFSERDFNIILNALSTVEKAQTRVYVSRPGHNLYEVASGEQFGTFTTYITNIYERMGDYMACNEYLERIATALETMQQAQDEQVVNLADVFEALGLEPSESEADILEALDYLLNFPGMPAIPKLPLGQWLSSYFEGRYRSAHLQLLRDIAISERGQAVAQGGIDFAALYDTMGETADSLLVKAGYAGKAYWLWRWIDNDQIPGWAGWVTTISGLLLGSIRNAAYDIAEALGLLELSPTVNNSITNNVECSSCGSTGSCGCGGFVSGNQPISEVLDAPVTTEPDREFDPPPTGNESWTEYDTVKCAWLNKVLDDYISTLQNIGSLFGFIGVLTAAVFAAMLTIAVPPVGIALVFAAVAGLIAIDTGLLANFNSIATELDNQRDDIICDLMAAVSTDEMMSVFYGYLSDIIPGVGGISGATQGFYIDACHGLQSNLLWMAAIENGGVQPEGYEGAECGCGEGEDILVVNVFAGFPANLLSGCLALDCEPELEGAFTGSVFGSNHTNISVSFTVPDTYKLKILSVAGDVDLITINTEDGLVRESVTPASLVDEEFDKQSYHVIAVSNGHTVDDNSSMIVTFKLLLL